MKANCQPFPCRQQQGFQKNMSSITASFNLHETIYNTVELNKVAYVGLLDIRKAFDTVSHPLLIEKLNILNIPIHYINIIAAAYSDMQSIVRVNGNCSKSIRIKNGVRQGVVLSSLLYLIYINDLIEQVERGGLGACICKLATGIPTLCDDISLVALTPLNLQKMLDTVSTYAYEWKFEISSTKSLVMIVSLSEKYKSTKFKWHINGNSLMVSQSASHVGVPISSDLKANLKVDTACRKGRQSFHGSLGFCNRESISLSPMEVAGVKLYKTVVQSSFLYGCEMWTNMTQSNKKDIDVFHHYCIKKLQYLPVQTRSAMCESLLGLGSLTAEIEIRKLLFFHKITTMQEICITKQIFLRRLFTYFYSNGNSNQLGFIPDLYKILCKYNLECYLHRFINNRDLPSKSAWNRLIRTMIYNSESHRLKTIMLNDVEFSRFREVHKTLVPYRLWKIPSSQSELKLIHFIIKCLTLIPQRVNQLCSYCNKDFTDVLLHITTSCQRTLDIRNIFLEYIVNCYTPQQSISVSNLDNEELLQFLLGKRTNELIDLDENESKQLVIVSANYVLSCIKLFYGNRNSL